MIKVTFKEKQEIWQHGFIQECMFCFCLKFIECGILTQVKNLVFSEEKGDNQFVFTHNIQSIEHVKPTDLWDTLL